MLFSSFEYIFFLIFVFFVFRSLNYKYGFYFLLVSSYYFYVSWSAKYVFLIIFVTVSTFLFSELIAKEKSKKRKLFYLWGGISIPIAMLFYYKYFGFFATSAVDGLNLFGLSADFDIGEIILPVGISFFTFQGLSYVIDVYKGEKTLSFKRYALYITFFPQLVAGPIERVHNLAPQFFRNNKFDSDDLKEGGRLILYGLFKKIVIADNCAVIVNAVFESPESYSSGAIFLATLLFGFQIYCDFSAYSDIAIGSARLFGIKLSFNFRRPYLAQSIREFWHRWHITLSTWFRDYVFIPLGGSKSTKFKAVVSLIITFLVSGFWHGASWNFILWGGAHGLFISLLFLTRDLTLSERVRSTWAYRILGWFLTFNLVMLLWIPFRAETLDVSLLMMQDYIIGLVNVSIYGPLVYVKELCFNDNVLFSFVFAILGILLVLIIEFMQEFNILGSSKNYYTPIQFDSSFLRSGVYVVLVFLIVFGVSPGAQDFIYFQF